MQGYPTRAHDANYLVVEADYALLLPDDATGEVHMFPIDASHYLHPVNAGNAGQLPSGVSPRP